MIALPCEACGGVLALVASLGEPTRVRCLGCGRTYTVVKFEDDGSVGIAADTEGARPTKVVRAGRGRA